MHQWADVMQRRSTKPAPGAPAMSEDTRMDYHLFGGPVSRAFRVIWMLEELGLPYQHTIARPHSAEVLAANPAGKIPALLADGELITDSTAILTFLADRHGALTHPAGSIARARQDATSQMINEELDGPLWAASRHAAILPEELRAPGVRAAAEWDFARSVTRLAEGFSGPFVMGDQMTVPDFLLTHCLGWAVVAKFPDVPKPLQDYHAAMRARPAYRRARATA